MNHPRADRRAFLGALAALGLSGRIRDRPARGDDAKPDPVGLARKVEALYASCRAYRDSGRLVQTFRDAEGKDLVPADRKPRGLATAFVRPDKFRFEFDDDRGGKPVRNLIWMDGAAVKTWWDIRPGIEAPESLSFALGAAAGVTESSSVTIPHLLLPKALGRPNALSAGPGELAPLEGGAIGPHACHRLRRRFKAVNFQTGKDFEVVHTYWIDAKTSAIRRVVNEMQLEEGRSVGTMDLEPEFDAEVPAEALAFDPPEVKP